MSNTENALNKLLLADKANGSYIGASLNRILNICIDLADKDLPPFVKEAIADIDQECCRLLRDRMMLRNVVTHEDPHRETDLVCSFPEVYDNCTNTLKAICSVENIDFEYSPFIPECKLGFSADQCCMLLVLPLALALELNKNVRMRLVAALKGDRLILEYTFSDEAPPVMQLAAKYDIESYSNGVYFPESLMALNIKHFVEDLGATLVEGKKKLTFSLPVRDPRVAVNTYAKTYIENRFSIPYTLLAEVIRVEI